MAVNLWVASDIGAMMGPVDDHLKLVGTPQPVEPPSAEAPEELAPPLEPPPASTRAPELEAAPDEEPEPAPPLEPLPPLPAELEPEDPGPASEPLDGPGAPGLGVPVIPESPPVSLGVAAQDSTGAVQRQTTTRWARIHR